MFNSLKNRRNIIVFSATTVVCMNLASLSQAALVLNFDPPSENPDILLNRTPDTTTTTSAKFNFSTSTAMFSGSGQNQVVYGGLNATAATSLSTTYTGNVINDLTAGVQAGLRSQFNSTLTESVRVQGIFIWQQAGFLTSGADEFDSTSESNFSMTVGTIQGTAITRGLRFVIRNGLNFYISNQNYNSAATHTLAGSLAGLEWGQFDPANFASFDIAATGLGLDVIFAPQTFDDVTGAGYIFDHVRSSAQGPLIAVTDFQLNLVPEPTTTMLAGGFGMLALLRRRRA